MFDLFLNARFVSWGISRALLFFMGVLPLLFVLAFHVVTPIVIGIGLLVAVLWVFFLSRGFYRFTQFYFWTILAGLTMELVFALRDKNFFQMTSGIVCVAVFLIFFQWLEKQIALAQHNPGIRWYEGLPQFFPRVQVEVYWGEKWYRASLRKIDHHGMFLFLQQSEQESAKLKLNRATRKSLLPLKLQYRDQVFEGDAKLQSVFYERWLGMGLQICPKDLYHFTQYSKIVQKLKGEDYAT